MGEETEETRRWRKPGGSGAEGKLGSGWAEEPGKGKPGGGVVEKSLESEREWGKSNDVQPGS